MITQLDLYILNSDNSVAPFPSEAEQIVLYDFAFEAQRMSAAPEITATIQANGSLENSLTTKVFCEYNGERYYLKNLPSSSKENTDPRYTFDLTFVSERTILDNVYMVDAVQGDGNIDRYQSNSANIMFTGTIEDLVGRLNASMAYAGVGYSVVLDEGITTESKLVSFQDKFFTEALQEGVKIFNVPYYYVGKVVHFGWAQNTIPTLRYGDGLLSINRSIRTERIVNRATATGSSENIPHYYPNPTPKGWIELVNTTGLNVVVDNYAKLSKIPQGSYLTYQPIKDRVEIFSIYSDDSGEARGKDDIFKSSTTIKNNSFTELIAGVKVVSSGDPIDVVINTSANIQTPNKNDISVLGVYVYKEADSINKKLVLDTDLTTTVQFSIESSKNDNGNTTVDVKANCTIHQFPNLEKRYVSVVLYNGAYSNTYPVTFRFENTQYGKNEGWYIASADGVIGLSPISLWDYGVHIDNENEKELSDASGSLDSTLEEISIGYRVIKDKVPYASSLMPPIYRNSDGVERFYNATNGVYEGVTFENEYSEENTKEAITKFEDIKPTIVGVTNANGERIDMFAEFAYDLNDSDETEQTDESSENFIHPYFYAKLRRIDGDNGFNLFAQAIESGEMTIEMTSGHCGACKFVIAVDENTQRNLVMVDDNGDLIYDDATGKVKMADDATGLDRQNDTQNYEVWIALKKDINTFGTVMPMANSTIKPSADDTFVITNILLPQAYFTAAEKKLEDEIIAFLAKNNTFQFEYDINFSRIFLKKRNDVFSKLTENSIIPIEYNGNKLSFYVSSYTYRKQKGEVLPEISISLTDNFDSTPSAFQQSINAIQENIVRGIGAVGLTLEDTDPRYLRKDVADTVKERTTFEKGMDFGGTLTSKGFKKGNLIGAGFGVYTDENGNTVVEADRMVIRKDAQFSEIVINQTTFQLGATVFSGGGCNITDVEEVEGAYRCYYDNKSGTRFSGFVVGDQARCQRFDESQKEIIKYYWRVVVAVGNNYVDLSTTDVDGTGVPEVGDDIVHFGNRTDKSRQSAIVINPLNGGSVEVYAGINSFSLEDKNYVGMGVNPNTNEAYMYGYGDIYIGDRDINAEDATYVTYQKKEGDSKRKVHISADVNLGKDSTGLSNLSDFQSLAGDVQDAQQSANEADRKAQSAQDYIDNVLPKELENLQNQIDGKKEEYYYDYDPTLDNYPASEWATEEDKESHLYDTFTNINTGQSWRWLYQDGAYQWVLQADTVANEALLKAQEALGVANGKRTIFVTEPYPPYQVGDLWVKGTAGRTMRCIIARDSDSFTASDWDYADDSHEYIDSEIAKYKKSVDVTIESLDAAIEAAEKASKDYTDEGKEALQASIDALNKAKANVTDVYDKATADGLINQAEADAIVAAQELADAARQLAIEVANSYADGVVDAEEKARIDQAEKNLAEAKKHAEDKAQDAEYNAKEYADEKFNIVRYLKDAFPQGSILNVNGVTLSALIGVKDNEENVVAGLYGGSSDKLNAEGYADKDYGAMLLFGGIEGVDKPTTYKTAIFENGYIISKRFQTSKEGKRVEIFGNELKVYGDDANNSVLSISYDSTGKPRLQYNDKSGNVSWYLSDKGISTSYTVEQIDEFLKRYIRNDISEDIDVIHKFVNGIKIGDILLTYDSANEALCINGNMYALGGITAGGVGSGGSGGGGGISYSRLDSWADYSADKAGYVLSALLGKDLDNRVSALANAGYVTASALTPYALRSEIPSLVGYATQSWVESKNYLTGITSSMVTTVLGYTPYNSANFTKANIKSTLGISDWALASAKPTYTASEVGALSVNGTAQSALKMTSEYLTDLNSATPWRFFDMNTGYGSTDGNKPNIAWVSGITGTTVGSSNYRWQLAMTTGSQNPYFRREHNGNWNNWSTLAFTSDIPTKLSQLTNDKINNRLTIDSLGDYTGLHIANDKELCGIRFSNSNTSDSGNLIYLGGTDYRVTNDGWTATYKLLHEGNYSNLLAGGTVNGSITATSFIGNLTGTADSASYILTKLKSSDAFYPDKYKAYIQWVSEDTAVMEFTDGDYQFRANSATKLATPRTIWGQSFDGTGNVNGDLFLPNNKAIYAFASDNSNAFHVASLGSDDIMRYGYASKVSHIRGNSVHLLYGSSHTTGFVLNSSGNVGIGGATADEKLHVYGNGKFTGALTANSLTIGGVTLTYDSVNEALCINGNMYALGGITAGGAGISAYTSLEARVARIEQQLNIS